MKASFIVLAVSATLFASCAARLPGVASGSTPAGAESAKAAPPAMTTATAPSTTTAAAAAPVAKAVSSGGAISASLVPLQGSKVNGTIRFTQKGDKVNVAGEIFDLTPGLHGIHIHEAGDCSAPDGTSAKGHFNPANKAHGAHMGERHGGDLGNLTANAAGMANLNLDVDGIALNSSSANGIVNRAVIVHADPDDLKTQPAGNSGKRIACGIIVQK
ncbi:MAG: superoxide dismutase family protein [Burkholderiales bacterium]